MPIGEGKYDDLCTTVRVSSKARAAIVIVVGGDKGSGFSVQGDWAVAKLPLLLENVAAEIRASLEQVVEEPKS